MPDHQSFDAEAFEYALAETGKEVSLLGKEELAEILPLLNVGEFGLTADDVYYSSKIPFAVNYVEPGEDYTNVYSGESHGSHVAGIAAANRYVKTADEGFENAAAAVGAVGMAPDAQIVSMQVFLQGGGTHDSDYMAALEDALTIGCDAANLSLGTVRTALLIRLLIRNCSTLFPTVNTTTR